MLHLRMKSMREYRIRKVMRDGLMSCAAASLAARVKASRFAEQHLDHVINCRNEQRRFVMMNEMLSRIRHIAMVQADRHFHATFVEPARQGHQLPYS